MPSDWAHSPCKSSLDGNQTCPSICSVHVSVSWAFPAQVHGSLSPHALNTLYNSCRVGLSLSMTNVSLIPWELLAAGVIPVVNDAPHNRVVLENDHVVWSEPTPLSLADALEDAYAIALDRDVPDRLSASVRLDSWSESGERVLAIIEGIVRR